MKRYAPFAWLLAAGVVLAWVFASVSAQNGMTFAARGIFMTLGIGMVCLSIGGLAWLRLDRPDRPCSDAQHLGFVGVAAVLGLVLLVAVLAISNSDAFSFEKSPGLYVLTNASLGLVFISIGFLVIYFVKHFKQSRKKWFEGSIEEAVDIASELPIQADRLVRIKEDIDKHASDIRRELEAVKSDLGTELDGDAKRITQAIISANLRSRLLQLGMQLLFLFIGAVLGRFVDVLAQVLELGG